MRSRGDCNNCIALCLLLIVSAHARMQRALKSIRLENDAKVTFDDFVRYNEQFPALFLPAFLLQNSFRSKVPKLSLS